MLDHTGSATYADNVEIVVGDGASLTVVSCRTGRTTRCTCRTTTSPGAGRAGAAHGGDAGRGRGAAVAVGALRRARGRCRAAGGVFRRRRAASGAPAVRGSHAAELPQPGGVQGGAAGGRGAHRVDRGRADPGGGDRDRHLRAEPEPAADRGRAGGLGAEPGDPHRRGGRRRAREHQREAGGPPPVLPDGPRHPAGRGAAPGDPRLLRRADRQDRRAGAAGPDRRGDRGRAGARRAQP